MRVFSLWLLSFLEKYWSWGCPPECLNSHFPGVCRPVLMPWMPTRISGRIAFLAGLACCVESPDVIALLLPLPWNFWHGMEGRGLPTLQILHMGDVALWCRSVWDMNSVAQIIKIANWRGKGKGYYKTQLLSSFPLVVVLSRLGTGLSSVGKAIAVDSI